VLLRYQLRDSGEISGVQLFGFRSDTSRRLLEHLENVGGEQRGQGLVLLRVLGHRLGEN
jgi:hypothetical protein